MNSTESFRRRQDAKLVGRRWFLEQCSVGLGAVALNQILTDSGYALSAKNVSNNPFSPRKPHYPAQAKNVIFLFMAGAPSHLELFDYMIL